MGKGELLLISSTPLNDTVQITETQGEGGQMKEEGKMKEGRAERGGCLPSVSLPVMGR